MLLEQHSRELNRVTRDNTQLKEQINELMSQSSNGEEFKMENLQLKQELQGLEE